MVTIGINGFGRIGRNFLRVLMADSEAVKKIKVVALNVGPASKDAVAHSFKYDSILGTYPGMVVLQDNMLIIDGQRIPVYAEVDPVKLEWGKKGVQWVVDVSGKFTKKADAQKHTVAGAQNVLISAPCSDADVTIILGVNSLDYSNQQIVSLGSCTTNAVAPILKILDESVGVQSAYMTTIHSYTNDQVLLDVDHSDLRRARAAALNIIPTTTGAMKVVSKVLPQLAGKVDGCSVRVPTAKVSLIDLSFIAKKQITAKSINDLLLKESQGSLKTIVGFTQEPLVSSDFSQDAHSVIIDGMLTAAVGTLGKIFGWYDNEWGYSCRLKDFLLLRA